MGYNKTDLCLATTVALVADVMDIAAPPTFTGYRYTLGQVVSPTSYVESPAMTKAQVGAVLDAVEVAGSDESDWLDAHPSEVKTWLNGWSAEERSCLYLAAVNYRA